MACSNFGISQRLDFSQTKDWTLDGTANLSRYDAGEKAAMDWLTNAPYGVIAEAVGGSYGPAARMGVPGDLLVILTYCSVSDEEVRGFHAKVVRVTAQNKLRR